MNLGILKLFKYLLIGLILFGCASVSQHFFIPQNNLLKGIDTNKSVEIPLLDEKKVKDKVVQKDISNKKINTTVEKEKKAKQKVIEKKEFKTIVIKEKQKVIEKKASKTVVIKEKQKEEHIVQTSTTLDKKNLKEFAFDMVKKGMTDDNTFLIVGGIQGDEPGGFMAASLVSTHYEITKGSVWIVPNLNFYSIIKRSRGPFGDMNRKFAYLPKTDPEYEIIQRIKRYITDPNVSLILNLHDGSGFYRPMYIDKNHQPNKWGQSLVIDQEILHDVKKYNDVYSIGHEVINYTNKHLLKEEDKYRVKNTHTRFKNTHEEKEMAKSLTYFAINHGKSAFGHETSKSLNVEQRVYYKLLAIEKFMDIMGIKFKRKFDLTVAGVKSALEDDENLKFDDTNIKMPLKDIRNIQKFFPIDKNGVVRYLPSNPLIKIIKKDNIYTIYYGNRRLTKLEADYKEHLSFETKVDIFVDGKKKKVKFGDTIHVKKYFNVVKNDFRVNVIGYKSKDGLETGKNIKKSQFVKRYSVQRHGELYRIEFYKGKKFAGMILVKYL